MRHSASFSILFLAGTLAACDQASWSPAGRQGTFVPQPPIDFEQPQESPSVQGVTPSLASPAMTVRIAGHGFGSDGSAVTVSFGGVETSPIEVSDELILVRPVAGGMVAADGHTEVRVVVGDETSNAALLRIGQAGDFDRIDTTPQETVGGVLALAGGGSLFTDPVGGRVYRISADGVVRAIAASMTLGTPGRMTVTPDGTVLVFDAGASTVWAYSAAEGSLSAWDVATPGWSDGAWLGDHLFALVPGATSLERVDAAGATIGFLPLSACAGASAIGALDGTLYVAAGAAVCSVDPQTGAESSLPLSGTTVYDVSSLATSGGALLATGLFAPGPSVASIEPSGAVTVVVTPTGFPRAVAASPAGLLVGLADGGVIASDAAGTRLVAARVRDLSHFRQADGRYLATGGYETPFLVELWPDGSYRVRATGATPSMWTHVEVEGDGFVIAAYDAGAVLRAAADGTMTTVLEHWSIGPVASFARHGDSFLLTSYGPDIARYSAAGELQDAHYIHAADTNMFGLVAVGSTVFAAAGDRLLEADAQEGGAAFSRIAPGVTGLLGVAVSPAGRIYVADGNGSGDILRVDADDFAVIGHSGAPISLAIAEDGAILVADLSDTPYRMLP